MRKLSTGFIILICSQLSAQVNSQAKVVLLLASNNISTAFTLLDSLEKFDKEFPVHLIQYYRADGLYKLKRFNDVIRICSDEITNYSVKDSLLKRFYYLEMNAYREIEKFTDAIYVNQKLIASFPDDYYAYHNISYLYGEVGDYQACFTALGKAVNIDPENVGALSNLSYYSSKIGEYNKAVNYATDGIKYATDSSDIGMLFNNRGFGEIGLKKYSRALEDIDESLKYKPINPYAYYNKALVYIQLKDFDRVCENLNKSKKQGGVNLTQELLKQYCNK